MSLPVLVLVVVASVEAVDRDIVKLCDGFSVVTVLLLDPRVLPKNIQKQFSWKCFALITLVVVNARFEQDTVAHHFAQGAVWKSVPGSM